MSQENCWDILGIKPTGEKLEIKRAFAKLAHTISPEDDPEGYRRIHTAYKQALEYASVRRPQKFIADVKAPVINTSDISEKKPRPDPVHNKQLSRNTQQTHPVPQFDFSSVITNGKEYTGEVDYLLEKIVNFKTEYGVDTKRNVSRWKRATVLMRSTTLLEMYASLYEKTKDTGVFDLFFEEPLIKLALNMPDFKDKLFEKFCKDTEVRRLVEEKITETNESMITSDSVINKPEAQCVRRGKLKYIGLALLLISVVISFTVAKGLIHPVFFGPTVFLNETAIILFFLIPKEAIRNKVTTVKVKNSLLIRNVLFIPAYLFHLIFPVKADIPFDEPFFSVWCIGCVIGFFLALCLWANTLDLKTKEAI